MCVADVLWKKIFEIGPGTERERCNRRLLAGLQREEEKK